MIKLTLDSNDIGLLCVVLADVIESNQFVDNEHLQKIHDKLKDSIIRNIDSITKELSEEYLKQDAIERIEYHTKFIQECAANIEMEGSVHKFNNIYASCSQILKVQLPCLKQKNEG